MSGLKECKKMMLSPVSDSVIFMVLWFCVHAFCLLPYYCMCTGKLYIVNFHYDKLYKFNNIFYSSGLFNLGILIILTINDFFNEDFGLGDAPFNFELGIAINLLICIMLLILFLYKRLFLSKKDGSKKMEYFFYCFGFVNSFISVIGFVFYMII